LQAQRRHLGVAYGLNTLAFCIGLVGFTLIAPRVSIFYSLKLSVWLLVLGTGLLLLVSERRRVVAWQPLTFAAAFLAACLLVPPGFDAAYLRPGGAPTKYPVRALRSNGAVTTFVVSMPAEERLYFGNLSMSGTNDLAQVYMRLMAHIPLLAQRAPRKALLICFGVGNTASAIAAHAGIEQIDIVDLNHQVFATAPEFSATHGDVHLDSRVRLIHDDGRNFLRVTDETYDLITSEPPPPMSGGVYRLYTAEYYADIRRHLTPDGVMSQWLPIYQMPGEAVDKVIATFVGAFAHTLLFVGYESELILVGSAAPIDLGRMTEGISASPSVAADLARIGIVEPVDLLARVLRTDASLRREYAGRGVLSDERNDLEHLYLAATRIPVVDYDPIEVSDYIATVVPVHAQTAREVITHLGRLRYRVPRFPVLSVRPDPDVALSDADWPAITRHIRDAQRHVRANQVEETIDALTHAVELAPAQPAVLEILADQYVAAGLYDQAILTLRQFQTVEPGNARSHGRIGGAYVALGRSREALPEFRRAIELDPASPEWLNNAAWILATHADGGVRQPAVAIGYAERAARLTDNADANVLDTLGVAYASAGRFADAVQVTQHAIDVARRNRQFDLAAAAQRRRALYQREQRVVDPG
jgi:Flp pilus assembly protein TadD